MPCVNIIDISNVGRQKLISFAIDDARISYEKLSAYTWIAECMDQVIWEPVSKKPGIIITDYAGRSYILKCFWTWPFGINKLPNNSKSRLVEDIGEMELTTN